MKKENTIAIAAVCIVMLMVVCGFVAIKVSSGVNPPFTVVESESMQHSKQSEIGIIDTGDMILVKSPSKIDIITFIDGYNTGYETFGDYGSVIVYNRNVGNPVIHRAILWLSPNDSGWSAPALEKYPHELWECTSGDDCDSMSGTLTIRFPSGYRPVDKIEIDLDNLDDRVAGYITMGDNNSTYDQISYSSISPNRLITPEKIKSVAWKEIPWIGAVKMIFKGNLKVIDSKVPNTVPNMTAFFVTAILTAISVGFLYDEYCLVKIKKRKKG